MFSNIYNTYKAGSSELRRGRANRALRNMRQPQFTPTPQMTSMYERTLREMYSPQGATTEEIGTFNQDLGRGATTTYRLGTAAGGGGAAQTLNAAVNAGMFGARSKFAEFVGRRKQANRQFATSQNASATNAIQSLANQNTQLELEKLRNLGVAVQESRIERDQAFADYAKNLDEGVGGLLSMATGGMVNPQMSASGGTAPSASAGATDIGTMGSRFGRRSTYVPYNLGTAQ